KMTNKLFHQVVPLFSPGARRPAWGRAVRLEETYGRCTRSCRVPGPGRSTNAAGPADGGNAKFAWYGAPSADVAAAVEHGFGRTDSQVLGHRAHGDDVHLSPPQSPYASAMLANADENGEAHIVPCRVLMGRPEAIPAGSSKLHPSSDNYDSAADNMQNPQWYVVWGQGHEHEDPPRVRRQLQVSHPLSDARIIRSDLHAKEAFAGGS
uniref:PARP catalytic domain-containing protein n=2 Tax=Aegilops tauschii subsp. strangulata TaxID=200361 RepID=A0A452ZWC2_AEGTS